MWVNNAPRPGVSRARGAAAQRRTRRDLNLVSSRPQIQIATPGAEAWGRPRSESCVLKTSDSDRDGSLGTIWLGERAQVGLHGRPALGEELLRLFVGDRRADDDVLAVGPVG